jgi:predicted transcriptional regulator
MSAFQKKLLALREKYSLSTTDLAVLLSVSRSNVFYWLNGVQPMPSKHEQLEEKIEEIIAARKFFPVPLSITQYKRKQYLLDAVNGRASKVSRSGSSSRR